LWIGGAISAAGSTRLKTDGAVLHPRAQGTVENFMARILSAALLFLGLVIPAFAQSQDPVALVKSFYVEGYVEADMPLSDKLGKLFKAAEEASIKAEGPVSGLDFSWTLNGQDYDENVYKSVKLKTLSSAGDKATVQALFKNFEPQEIHYLLVKEKGAWVVDDIVSKTGDGWKLSALLAEGAKGN
jgi:Protein of unknown function (DUF3828)